MVLRTLLLGYACLHVDDLQKCQGESDLIPVTVPEVRRLLWGVVWRAFPSVEHVLAWSVWRRHHQAVAKRCHYRQRGVML